jgi:hypothetical protein
MQPNQKKIILAAGLVTVLIAALIYWTIPRIADFLLDARRPASGRIPA